MRALPLLPGRQASLETCVYCPKLCRASCPVSNVAPRETLTPWGKMSTAYFMARGDAPIDRGHGATAWACTGCHACRERCDHRNEVAPTLDDARAMVLTAGAAPAAAREVLATRPDRERALREATARLADAHLGGAREGRPMLLGCGYARHLPEEARDAIEAARALVGPVRRIDRCCGLPWQQAGDRAAASEAARAIADELRGQELLVVDPGCALALRRQGVAVRLLVEEAAAQLPRLRAGHHMDAPVRYHDPCQLGRGLGVYEAPRAILGRLLGAPVGEFFEAREGGACSGGGGMLPATMPGVSRAIAGARVAAHESAGGGEIVTACASSLRSFRAAGARASDLVTWIARALRA